jgi:hypothetical protein
MSIRRPARCLPQLISGQATEIRPFVVVFREIQSSPERSSSRAAVSAVDLPRHDEPAGQGRHVERCCSPGKTRISGLRHHAWLSLGRKPEPKSGHHTMLDRGPTAFLLRDGQSREVRPKEKNVRTGGTATGARGPEEGADVWRLR